MYGSWNVATQFFFFFWLESHSIASKMPLKCPIIFNWNMHYSSHCELRCIFLPKRIPNKRKYVPVAYLCIFHRYLVRKMQPEPECGLAPLDVVSQRPKTR